MTSPTDEAKFDTSATAYQPPAGSVLTAYHYSTIGLSKFVFDNSDSDLSDEDSRNPAIDGDEGSKDSSGGAAGPTVPLAWRIAARRICSA